jgi:hypothetical protein
MVSRATIRKWCSSAGLLLIFLAPPLLAQHRRDQQRNVPRPNVQQPRQENRPQRREERRESRPQPNPPRTNLNRDAARPPLQSEPASPTHVYPQYQPPTQGHHSGQWLNQQRQKPPDQQRKALESDPAFRRLPRETQREYEQRLQRFNSMPSDRQHQVLRRMETWEHLTPQQKQDFLGMRNQFNSLPTDRRRAVHNAIDTLRAMPPNVRQRELQSGRFSQFSPQERQILDDATRLPLAPAPQQSGGSGPESGNSQQNSEQHRYVPRPPR